MKQFRLEILTPYGLFLQSDEIEIVNVPSTDSVLGILANHAPLIADVKIGEINILINGKREYFATTGGLVYVKKEKVVLLLDTIEKGDEIDLVRALSAKERAEKLLENKNPQLDELRAKAALSIAINRINVAKKYK
jgi:F-type H+-transporting ATPase subunit epsilon